MSVGRKPTPTRLKLIKGNPGKRPINEGEPKPKAAKSPRAPAHLNEVASKEYKRIVKQLTPLGLCTEIDLKALELYAETYATWFEAMDKVHKVGLVVKTPTGFPVQNPYFSIANQTSKRLQSLMSEFGLTPAARSRINVEPPKDGEFDDV